MDEDRQDKLKRVLAQAVRGDHSAFAEIVAEHQAMVFSIAWRYLQDRSLAEDVAQEVFLELYQKLSTIQSPAHLTFWLRRVAAHRSIDQGRKQGRRQESPLEVLPDLSAESRGNDPLLSERLRQILATLPEKQRMIVLLRFQEEMGPEEIAELLEMPVNTIKSTLHRALEELRRKLTGTVGEARYAFF